MLTLAVGALVFGQWLVAEPPIALSRDISPLNPRLFPNIVLVGIIAVAIAFIINRVRGADAMWDPGVEPTTTRDVAGLRRLLLFLLLVVVCALVLDRFGFLTTMFLLMVATSILIGNDNVPQIIGVSIALPLGIYIVVTHFLRTSLPELDFVESALAPILALLPSF